MIEDINDRLRMGDLKGKRATVTDDYYTDDECSFGVLIKKGSLVYIKETESDGTCYVNYLGFVFSIDRKHLNIATTCR